MAAEKEVHTTRLPVQLRGGERSYIPAVLRTSADIDKGKLGDFYTKLVNSFSYAANVVGLRLNEGNTPKIAICDKGAPVEHGVLNFERTIIDNIEQAAYSNSTSDLAMTMCLASHIKEMPNSIARKMHTTGIFDGVSNMLRSAELMDTLNMPRQTREKAIAYDMLVYEETLEFGVEHVVSQNEYSLMSTVSQAISMVHSMRNSNEFFKSLSFSPKGFSDPITSYGAAMLQFGLFGNQMMIPQLAQQHGLSNYACRVKRRAGSLFVSIGLLGSGMKADEYIRGVVSRPGLVYGSIKKADSNMFYGYPKFRESTQVAFKRLSPDESPKYSFYN